MPRLSKERQVLLGGGNMKKKRRAKAWYRHIPWIAVGGAVLIFVSWILQNHYSRKWSGEVQDLINRQLTLDVQQLRMEMWNAAFIFESSRMPVNKEALGVAAFKMVQAMANMSAWSADRFADSESRLESIYNAKARLKKRAEGFLKDRAYDSLITVMHAMIDADNSLQLSNIESQAAVLLRNKIEKKTIIANVFFVLTYALGSVLIGYQWMREKLSVDNKFP
jgi:hypothetical protein